MYDIVLILFYRGHALVPSPLVSPPYCHLHIRFKLIVFRHKDREGLFETQRDVKVETTFMPYVARKLNFRQLENALVTPLPAVIKGYATLRDAKLAESSYDKVVMWTGGSYDYDHVAQALVRLDRPEMRPGTSGQCSKTIPTYFIDLESDAPTVVSGSEIWTQPKMDQTHWKEVLFFERHDVVFVRCCARMFKADMIETRKWN